MNTFTSMTLVPFAHRFRLSFTIDGNQLVGAISTVNDYESFRTTITSINDDDSCGAWLALKINDSLHKSDVERLDAEKAFIMATEIGITISREIVEAKKDKADKTKYSKFKNMDLESTYPDGDVEKKVNIWSWLTMPYIDSLQGQYVFESGDTVGGMFVDSLHYDNLIDEHCSYFHLKYPYPDIPKNVLGIVHKLGKKYTPLVKKHGIKISYTDILLDVLQTISISEVDINDVHHISIEKVAKTLFFNLRKG